MAFDLSRAVVLAFVLGWVGCAESPYVARPLERGFVRGVALGFITAEDARFGRTLSEVGALGATEISLLVPLYTEGLHGTTVRRGALDDARGGDGTEATAPVSDLGPDERAQSDAQLRDAILRARRDGLGTLVFPIVRLRVRNPGEWRGALDPADREAWWQAYADEIVAVATVAAQAGADRLAIGSELVSFEAEPARWEALSARVRRVFAGRILYSANWDRYRDVRFWPSVDEVGISAYFSLAPRGSHPSVPELVRAWQPIVNELRVFSGEVGRPVLFTEVGFPSVHGAAFWPWNDHQNKRSCASGEGCDGALDLEAQRRLWAAFVRVFGDRERTRFVHGLFAWLWSGEGGLRDRGYSPRGKPAQAVLRLWYGGARPLPHP